MDLNYEVNLFIIFLTTVLGYDVLQLLIVRQITVGCVVDVVVDVGIVGIGVLNKHSGDEMSDGTKFAASVRSALSTVVKHIDSCKDCFIYLEETIGKKQASRWLIESRTISSKISNGRL